MALTHQSAAEPATTARPDKVAPPPVQPREFSAIGRMVRTTAVKLSLVYLVVFSLVSVALVAYIAHSTNAILTAELRDSVDTEVRDLQDQYARGGILRVVRILDNRSRQPGAGLYLVTDTAGQPLLGNISDLPTGVVTQAENVISTVPYTRLNQSGTQDKSHVALVRVISLDNGFRVLVGRDVSEREKFSSLMWEAMRAVFIVTVLLGLVTWWFVSRSVLKRIEQVALTSNKIVAGDLTGRLLVTGSNDEFDQLAVGLNHMLDRISELMHGLKEVSDNIAHDLKTPLTRLRNRAEEALSDTGTGASDQSRAALEGVIDDCDGLIRTFDALLTIARVEAGNRAAELVALDPADVAREVLELYEPTAEEDGVSVVVVDRLGSQEPGSAGRLALANRELLAQAIANLLDNALKYGRAEYGPSNVRIELQPNGDEIVVSVIDNGIGIPADDRERVLTRFVRLEASRNSPGSGLGLSLVSAIARQHGTALLLEDAHPGLKVSLNLKRAVR
jgi:signal transduction histidine kinase